MARFLKNIKGSTNLCVCVTLNQDGVSLLTERFTFIAINHFSIFLLSLFSYNDG